jgi:hypothetical protein
MPHYRTRHLTARDHKLVDALEASTSRRQRDLAAKLRPPVADDAPPKPRRGRPPKVRTEPVTDRDDERG